MGYSAVSSTSRSIIVSRAGTALSSGASYVPGETLSITLSSTANEYVLQAAGGASFVGGSCSQWSRVIVAPASLVMPQSDSETITISAGWTTSESTVFNYCASTFL